MEALIIEQNSPRASGCSIYVSNANGSDAYGCGSNLQPCRTLEYVLHNLHSPGQAVCLVATATSYLPPSGGYFLNVSTQIYSVQGQAIIDCSQNTGPAFNITAPAAITGFLIQHCRNPSSIFGGGGIFFLNGDSLTVTNCVFNNNTATLGGGAIYALMYSPSGITIANNAFFGVGCRNRLSP